MARASLVLGALLLAAGLAGCASDKGANLPPEVTQALVDTRAMDWSPGNWWAYHATIQNQTFDLALIVHERTPDGSRLGTNLSIGFFGLPFDGNVSTDLNPRIALEEWPLFDFPLEDGKTWTYRLFGYDARTTARAALVELPGVGARPGFEMTATSFGAVFARYSYVPEAGWFTSLELIEPTNGKSVLLAELTSYGHDWQRAYYVEESLREVRIPYPALPGAVDIEIPDGFLQTRALLLAQASAGALRVDLRDEKGRDLAKARVVGSGVDTERAVAKTAGGALWELDHAGAGMGVVILQVTGITAKGPLSAPTTDAPALDLAGLLQSTRPAYPQVGHSIGSPLFS